MAQERTYQATRMVMQVMCACAKWTDDADTAACIVCGFQVCEDCSFDHTQTHVSTGELCVMCFGTGATHNHGSEACITRLCGTCAREDMCVTCPDCTRDRDNAHRVVRHVRHQFNNAAGTFHDIANRATRVKLIDAMDALQSAMETRDTIEQAWNRARVRAV